jgi:hypothetical protein
MSPGLSWHEHQILVRIENELRSDRALDRALRTMHAPPRRLAVRHWAVHLGSQIPAVSLTLMLGFAVLLTVMVAQIGAESAFMFLGVVWGATMVALGAKLSFWRHGQDKPGSG